MLASQTVNELSNLPRNSTVTSLHYGNCLGTIASATEIATVYETMMTMTRTFLKVKISRSNFAISPLVGYVEEK